MPITENPQSISEQIYYIYKGSEELWSYQQVANRWSDFGIDGWMYDWLKGFLLETDYCLYRVTDVSNLKLSLYKCEEEHGERKLVVVGTRENPIFSSKGSELVELPEEEVLQVLISLNRAIAEFNEDVSAF